MKTHIGKLGRIEWELMNICWKNGRKTPARVIYEESIKRQMRHYSTVKTMLDRMVRKGFLEKDKFGPLWLYSPKKNRKIVIAKAIDDFIKTVTCNETVPIIKHIIESNKYETDAETVKSLLKEIAKK